MAPKRPAKTVAIVNQKGGGGKTTATMHFAVQAEATGFGPVVMIDFDPQQSLAHMFQKREAPTPALAQADVFNLSEVIDRLKRDGFGMIFVDTPPSISDASKRAVAACDFVLVPMQASPIDLDAVGPAIDMIKAAKKPFMFFMNRIKANTTIAREAVAALSRHGRVATKVLGDRTDFACSMIDGRTIQELNPRSVGAAEVVGLWQEVADTLYPAKRKDKPYA